MIVKAIFYDDKKVLPVSVHLEGEYGQHHVAAGVPVVLGQNGVEEVLEILLNENEKQEFDRSCDVIRGYLKQADTLLCEK